MPPPQISVVIPTYREAENLAAVAEAIDAALKDELKYEVIIADDYSGDGAQDICNELSKRLPLRLLTRREDRGLSQAVLAGVAMANGEVIVVMDADLSHPPEKIAALARPLLAGEADFTVGSRYIGGGGAHKDWPLRRRIVSAVATIPAKLLTPLADPMSGFFAFRRAELPRAESLSPIGYKIGLELAVKMNPPKIKEIPIFFRDRERGDSKLNLREQLNYLRHLRRLFWHRWPKRMEVFQFCAVGGVGMMIDLAVYFALQFLGLPHLWARAFAFWPAVSFNWFLNRIMTFKTRPRITRWKQWLQYSAIAILGFTFNWGTYAILTSKVTFFADNLLAAFFAGVLVGTAFNFICSDRIVFRA